MSFGLQSDVMIPQCHVISIMSFFFFFVCLYPMKVNMESHVW